MSSPEQQCSRRVALFTSNLEGGGAQRSMLKLAGGLAERGLQVDLVLSRASGPYLAQVSSRVRVVDLGAPRLLAAIPALVRYLRRERPAAMLSALDYVNVVAVVAKSLAAVPVRLLVSERNTLSTAASNSRKWRTRMMPALVSRFYRWADGVIAVSSGVADDLAMVTGLERDRVRVIYNPVVTAAVARMKEEPVRHAWLSSSEAPVVLAVGRLYPQKDFQTLIRSFALVREVHPARLLILGDGPDRARLEALVRELALEDVVDMPGFTPNPYPYMAAASVFVLSSQWEGLPGSLIEAMYCGTRIVSTDCPSGPSEVLAGGRHGQLVAVGDERAMALAISRALDGDVPPPEVGSWHRFEAHRVVDQYIEALLGSGV